MPKDIDITGDKQVLESRLEGAIKMIESACVDYLGGERAAVVVAISADKLHRYISNLKAEHVPGVLRDTADRCTAMKTHVTEARE